jgi:hypothetical protein
MAKKIIVVCDRCGKKLGTWDDLVNEDDYPGQDICADCDAEIQIGTVAGRQAAIERKPIQEILSRWMGLYE